MPLLLVTTPGCNLKSNFKLSIHQLVLEVHILDGAGLEPGDVGQRQIMRADQSDRASLDQVPE